MFTFQDNVYLQVSCKLSNDALARSSVHSYVAFKHASDEYKYKFISCFPVRKNQKKKFPWHVTKSPNVCANFSARRYSPIAWDNSYLRWKLQQNMSELKNRDRCKCIFSTAGRDRSRCTYIAHYLTSTPFRTLYGLGYEALFALENKRSILRHDILSLPRSGRCTPTWVAQLWKREPCDVGVVPLARVGSLSIRGKKYGFVSICIGTRSAIPVAVWETVSYWTLRGKHWTLRPGQTPVA